MIFAAVLALFFLFASGTHVAVAFGLVTAMLVLMVSGVPPVVIGQTALKSVNSYSLMAIPFFLFAGNLMMRGQIAALIIDLVACVVKLVRGGLALSVMVASVFFAAVAGSSLASTVAIGTTMVDRMELEHYPRRFSAGVIAVGGTLGLMIPPSLAFILIGVIIGLPIDKLFLAGLVPGLMEATLLSVTTFYLSWRRGFGDVIPRPDWRGFFSRLPRAAAALAMPLVVLGSLYGGIFTPTEVSAVAAGYALLICLLLYRTMGLADVWQAAKHSVLQTTMIFAVFMGGSLIGFMLVRIGFSITIQDFIAGIGLTPWMFLLAVNLLLLVLGMFLDGVSLTVLTAPVLFPLATGLGVNPIHFAVIVVANTEIAVLTPPVGINLFVMSGLTRLPVQEVIRGTLPFYLTRLVSLGLITYVPAISLVLVA